MASPKRMFWVYCEWAIFNIPCNLDEHGAIQVLDEVNRLTQNYSQAGYEVMECLQVGPPHSLVFPGSGQVQVQTTMCLFGLRDFRDAKVQQEFLELAREREQSLRASIIESERGKAAEQARQEVQAVLSRAERDAERAKTLSEEIGKLNS